MAVWIITVIIGAYLLAAGITNEHRQAAHAASYGAGEEAPAADGPGAPAREPVAAHDADASGPATDQVPAAEAGGRATDQVPAARTAGPAAGHLLLEFCHPALAVTGLMFWIFFVVSDHSVFAWIAFGMLATTALAGITWLVTGIEGRRRARIPTGPVFPRHLVLLHGIAVTCTFTLVLSAAAGHG